MTTDPAEASPPVPTGVRTTRRRGRTSSAKVAALRDLGPRWTLPADGPWDPKALVGATGPATSIRVDIGVGDGTATRAWAEEHPDDLILAFELHRPGIAKLLTDLDAGGPGNVRVSEADALAVLDRFEPASIAAIRVLFPDPWPKRRHVERRLVDRAFVVRAAQVLEPAGELHLATDSADYASHMGTMVATERAFVLRRGAGRPNRPVTAYEQRGLDAGRTIVDLVYDRTA